MDGCQLIKNITMQANIIFFVCLFAISTGIYVAQEECPPNEEYLLCGSACPFNCTDPAPAIVCTEECVEGCFCKSGYLRNDNGTCVPTDECGGKDSICDPDEEFLSCGTACPGTCKEPEPLICGLACSMGCFCKAGYVRNTVTGQCVTLDKCPVEKCTKPNEAYDICNGLCDPSCDDPEPICPYICSGGCICASGYLRNATGECVTADQCGYTADKGAVIKHLSVITKLLQP